MLLSLESTPTHQTLSRQSHCISYRSYSHQLPSRLLKFRSLWCTSVCHTQTPTSLKLSRQNCSPVRQSSSLQTSSTATSLATCSQQNTFQTCHHYIQSPLYELSSKSRFAHSLSSISPFSSLLRPALSCPHSTQH